MIGLCGAHRTGKTSLARAYAEKHGIAFVETSVSAIFRDLGHDPSATFDFKTRLDIQEVILERLDAVYGSLNPADLAITDRTPIDMLGYTMSEAVGESVTTADQDRFKKYVDRCFDVTNRRFSTLVLVQPGIPLVFQPGKAIINAAYIDHLNSLMLGLSVDQRVKMPHYYIPRQLLTIEDRLAALENAVGRAENIALHDSQSWRQSGGMLQ
jgi:predicted ATPase